MDKGGANGKSKTRDTKKPVELRDALGRRARAERRLIESPREKRNLQPGTSNHRVVAIIQRRLKEERKDLKLSRNAAAEVTGVSRTGIIKIEKCDGNGTISTMAFLISGYRLRLDLFFRGVWCEYMKLAQG